MGPNKKKLLKLFLEKATPVKTIPPDCVIVVQLAEGYDLKGDHKFWKLEANRSYPRDIVCAHCSHQVVMSNKAYADYIANGKKNEVACAACLLVELKKAKKEELLKVK